MELFPQTNGQIAESKTIYYRHVKLKNLYANSIQYLCTCIDTGSTLVLASFRSLKCQCIEQVTGACEATVKVHIYKRQ